MLITGFALLIVGVVVSFAAFVFAARNMGRAFENPLSLLGVPDESGNNKGGFGSFFGGHIGAMIAMAVGGFAAFIGILLIVIYLVQEFVG